MEEKRSVLRAKQLEEDAALLAAAGGAPSSLVDSPPDSWRGSSMHEASIAEDDDDDAPEGRAPAAGGAAPSAPKAASTSGIDKSGWMLKTGPPSRWHAASWSERFFVLVGGSLYYFRAQELDEPAGLLSLGGGCTVAEGVPLRSAPAGAFTISVPADKQHPARAYRVSAGSADEMHRWIGALRVAIGQPAREPPPLSAIGHLATLSGSVTATGGSSLGVRIQKHYANKHASDDDLTSVLGRSPGLLPALRAMQAAYGHVHGTDAQVELNRKCFVLAAKAEVLLRNGLLGERALAVAASAMGHALEHACEKERKVRPKDRAVAARLLPGYAAVDSSDPFHVELASSIRSIGSTLGAALGPHLSEATRMSLQDSFTAISTQEVLASLFGNALRPSAGIVCTGALQELLDAAAAAAEAGAAPTGI